MRNSCYAVLFVARREPFSAQATYVKSLAALKTLLEDPFLESFTSPWIQNSANEVNIILHLSRYFQSSIGKHFKCFFLETASAATEFLFPSTNAFVRIPTHEFSIASWRNAKLPTYATLTVIYEIRNTRAMISKVTCTINYISAVYFSFIAATLV